LTLDERGGPELPFAWMFLQPCVPWINRTLLTSSRPMSRPSIPLVEIWFDGQLIQTPTTVQLNADAPLRERSPGSYPLDIRVCDGVRNETTLNRTVTK
jgi:hypothetical protein